MGGKRINVLLIEDDTIYCNLLKRLLNHAGIKVDLAESLGVGLQMAAQNVYLTILLNLDLADSQGLNTFVKFKAFFPDIPIIILTGSDDEQLAVRAVQQGAQDYLIKGIDLTYGKAGINLLVRSIRYAIERHQIQSALQQEHDLLERRIIMRTIELSNVNEQLKRELAERRRYEFIANTSKDPISLIDRNYIYQAVNDGFCLAQDMRREDLVGRSIAEVWGVETFESQIKPFFDEALGGLETEYEGWFPFKTLGYRYFEVFFNPFFDSDQRVTHVVVVSHDETIREKAKESLRHHNQRLSTLREIDHATLIAKSDEDIAREALSHFFHLVPYDRADILLFAPNETSAKTMITGNADGKIQINQIHINMGKLLKNKKLLEGRPYLIDFSQQSGKLSPYENYLRQNGIVYAIIVPLVTDGQMIGVLSVSSKNTGTFNSSHFEDTQAISIPLTLLIKNAQLLEQLRNANQRLINLTSSLVSAQEDERRRISLELHDEAGQALIALKLNLAILQAELPDEFSHSKAQIGEAITLTEQTMEGLRALAHNLHPPAIDAVGLSQTLEDYCQRVERQSGIHIDFKDGCIADLPGHIKVSIFRLVQEALTNIVKHSGASIAEIRLTKDTRNIFVLVTDNGRGFSKPPPVAPGISKGLGLIGIQERIEALGGSLEIVSQAGTGTRLYACVPLQEGM